MAVSDYTPTVDSERFWRGTFIAGVFVGAVGLAALLTILSLLVAVGAY